MNSYLERDDLAEVDSVGVDKEYKSTSVSSTSLKGSSVPHRSAKIAKLFA